MSSLYKRATPRQAKLLRMIEGACRDAANAHPGQPVDEQMARSISKRAAGTISSAWRDVLATPRAWSDRGAGDFSDQRRGVGGPFGKATDVSVGEKWSIADARRAKAATTWLRGASKCVRRAPLRQLHAAVGVAAGDARKAGQTERLAALVDVLRLLAAEIENPSPPEAKLWVGEKRESD